MRLKHITTLVRHSAAILCIMHCALCITSCEDMLTKDSDYYLYADKDHLHSSADTVNSVIGIVNKLQAIAVRTNLLGEVRADLVTLGNAADQNLRELADNNISDDNCYNSPRDYYAVINNCNYFLARVDSTVTNVARDTIFRKEMDAVRVYRAWTYLQLAMNYDRVPLVTEPILSEADAERWETVPRTSFLGVCDYFINDLTLNIRDDEMPNYGRIDDAGRINPLLIFFPRLVVLGDLYLWRNALTGNIEDAKQAAWCYYKWISMRNTTSHNIPGRNSYLLASNNNIVKWSSTCVKEGKYNSIPSFPRNYGSVRNYGSEYITCIPMDSASNKPNFNQLRVLYNSRDDNNYQAAIRPSDVLRQISNSQAYCAWSDDKQIAYYPTAEDIQITTSRRNVDNTMLVGDLRFNNMVSVRSGREEIDGKYVDCESFQDVYKLNNPDISLYTTGMLYLRLAEAMNAAGYPSFASTILTWGLSNYSIEKGVLPYCTTKADSAFVTRFDFPDEICQVFGYSNTLYGDETQIGIHSRGSGLTCRNDHYYHSAYSDAPKYVPYKYTEEDSLTIVEQNPTAKPAVIESKLAAFCDSVDAARRPVFFYESVVPYYASVKGQEQNLVDSLIQVEWALEECFDGTRFYNLMRADYRYRKQRLDNGEPFGCTEYPLAIAVSRRNPSVGDMLKDENRWYLKWQGKIGR